MRQGFRLSGWVVLAGVSLVALVVAAAQLVPGSPLRLRPGDRDGVVAGVSGQPTQVPVAAAPARTAVPTRTRPEPTVRPAVTPTPALADRQIVPAYLGSVTERVQLAGRVIAETEAPLGFSIKGTLDTVAVSPGQAVRAGQVLATLDTTEVARQLKDVQSERQINLVRLQQLQLGVAAEAAARQQQAQLQQQQAQLQAQLREQQAQLREQQAQAREQLRQQKVVEATAAAEEQLRRARVNYDRVKAGASPAERLSTQGAVATAEGALERARTDLARLTAGPMAAEIAVAEQQVNTAQLALTKTQNDRDTLLKAADPATVAAARKDVADAQASVVRAANPEPSTPGAPKMSAAEREQVQASAQFALTAARAKLDTLLKGADKATVDLANMALENAKADLTSARTRLDVIRAGPTPEQLTAATHAVEVARLGLTGAQARLTEVLSHPTDEELRLAQQQIDAAQAALEAAAKIVVEEPATPAAEIPQLPAEAPRTDTGSIVVKQLELQVALDQQQAQIAWLQQQIEASQLRAPYNGTIQSLANAPGDAVEARRPVAMLANAGPPLVVASVSESDAERLAQGNLVKVGIDVETPPFQGSIVGVEDSAAGAGRQVRVQVAWPDQPPTLGSNVQVDVIVNHRDGVLLVPQRAIRSVGDRRTVDVLESGTRRSVDVKVGVLADGDAEILSGLTAGQLVILPL